MYVNSMNKFSNILNDIIKKYINFHEYCSYLKDYMEIENKCETNDSTGVLKLEEINEIKFQNVYFSYPKTDKFILKKVFLEIHKGEKIAIVGLNGAGKTTFVKLLTCLYQPTQGQISVNGINIKNYNIESYYSGISTVFQDFTLFDFSIKENIGLNKADIIKDDEIEKILTQVGLLNSINKLKNGIHTHIGKSFDDNGVELSGGQNQKIAIARMVLKNASLMILDEPTSALDPISEHEMYDNINKYININKNRIAIFISHRLSSCKFCDKIIVFHGGEIVQLGSHDELITQGGIYKDMWNTQAQYYAE